MQYAAPDTVVAAFVTYDSVLPADPPVAMFGVAGETPKQLSGIAHWYVEPLLQANKSLPPTETGRNCE